MCLKCPRGSPTLPPLSSSQLQAPGGEVDRLLPKRLHDFSYPSQVCLAEYEVTPSGSHVVADHAVLGGGDKALCLCGDHVFTRVQEAPVIPIAGWEEKAGDLRADPF